MKKLKILLVLLLLPFLIHAQTVFKGSIKYQIDIGTKKDSQFAAYIPTHSVTSTNGTEFRIKSLNAKGNIMMEFLTAKGQSYMVDKVDKVAYKMPNDQGESKETYKVNKTNEFETILNHKCRKYTIANSEGKIVQNIWAAADFKLSSLFVKYLNMGNNSFSKSYEQIEGIPLKIKVGEGENVFELKAVSISNTPPAEAELKLPADFGVEEFNPMVMAKIMMRGN